MGVARKIVGAIAWVCIPIGIAVTAYVCYTIYVVITMMNPKPGPFDRGKMESIVAQVRSQKFEGEKGFWWIATTGTSGTLIAQHPGTWNQGTGVPWFINTGRSSDKTLKVVIITAYGGRAGNAGYAYSDVPLQLSARDQDGLQSLDLPSFLCYALPDMKIDDHWWQVYQNGD